MALVDWLDRGIHLEYTKRLTRHAIETAAIAALFHVASGDLIW
jgi:hypothetical protein